jgi:hypothetical protein
MSSSLFSSFQENTKCESSFFADTCTRRVPIFLACPQKKSLAFWLLLASFHFQGIVKNCIGFNGGK